MKLNDDQGEIKKVSMFQRFSLLSTLNSRITETLKL
jgi:hypothetical protein